MGKVKYRKHVSSGAGFKTEKKSFFISEQSHSKSRKEFSPLTMSEQRRAIISSDLSEDKKLALACQKYLQNKSVDKGRDSLHLTKQDKRARKRMLAKKKMAGAFGNMGSLVDALPVVGEVRNRSVKEKPRLSKSLKTQEMEMVKDIQWYCCAVQDPSFQADPFAAVAANVRMRLINEQK